MPKKPITSADDERFMAFEGLVQWTQAAVLQARRLSEARDRQVSKEVWDTPVLRRQAVLDFHTQCHFFVVAAHKMIEYRRWCASAGLCAAVDFSAIDPFPEQDVRDLRNMREHIVEYFQGGGYASDRWFAQTPEFKADASSVVGTKIGGRLLDQVCGRR
jgi:hypothetical protein